MTLQVGPTQTLPLNMWGLYIMPTLWIASKNLRTIHHAHYSTCDGPCTDINSKCVGIAPPADFMASSHQGVDSIYVGNHSSSPLYELAPTQTRPLNIWGPSITMTLQVGPTHTLPLNMQGLPIMPTLWVASKYVGTTHHVHFTGWSNLYPASKICEDHQSHPFFGLIMP